MEGDLRDLGNVSKIIAGVVLLFDFDVLHTRNRTSCYRKKARGVN